MLHTLALVTVPLSFMGFTWAVFMPEASKAIAVITAALS